MGVTIRVGFNGDVKEDQEVKKLLITLALVIGLVTIFSLKASTVSAAPNCGPGAVVKCGVYDQGDVNAARPDAKELYAAYGVSTDLSKAVIGTISVDGTVKVNGKVVATNALTFGRINRTGSDKVVNTASGTFYQHTMSDGGFTTTVEAYVFLTPDGIFKNAIIRTCGNPVIVIVKPKPQSIVCKELAWVSKDMATRTVTVKLSGTPTNTTISGYKIAFGDGATSTSQTATHTYTRDGTFVITGYVSGKVNGATQMVTGAGCTKTITFETPKVQTLQCTLLKFNEKDTTKRYVSVTLTGYASNTTITGYKIDFGDNTVVNQQTASHTYAQDGTHTITGYVTGTVNGQPQTVTYKDCAQEISFTTPTTPEVLPNTGAGSVLGIFGATTALGAIGYRLFVGRKVGANRE